MIPRIPVDSAIERWLRALERAESLRSTSALLAQAQEYGCTLHGGGCVEPALCGLIAAERAVRLLSSVERSVLRAKYAGGVAVEVRRQTSGGEVTTEVRVRLRSDDEVAAIVGMPSRRVRRVIKLARAKVWRGLQKERGC